MVFSSILFLYYFLPVVLVVYFLTPKKYKNLVLLLASLFFYGWGEPAYLWLLLLSTAVDYTCGKGIMRNRSRINKKGEKKWVVVSVVINLSLLIFFKYADFIVGNINNISGLTLPLLGLPLPIGISFYTFQTMSYTIDIYRNEAEVSDSIISFGSYVALFPQLIAGPIVRYKTIAAELKDRVIDGEMISYGVSRFVIGLGKKVLIANNVGLVWETVFALKPGELTVLSAWLGIIAFALQIYFDFSAYSDMAIGLGKIFGFNFLENFNYPYLSTSITEFWRRWHISLGTWFREYVYIPLGGNRKGIISQIKNILVVWFLTGIWHGASWNFIAWGMMFGILLIVEKIFLLDALKKLPVIAGRAYTLIMVLLSWVIFSHEDFGAGVSYIKSMLGSHVQIFDDRALYMLYTNALLLNVAIVGSTDLPKRIWNSIREKGLTPRLVQTVVSIGILLLSTAYLVDQSYNPFLYFRF